MKNENNLKKMMTNYKNVRVMMIICGMLLTLALIGTMVTASKPRQVKREINLVSYTQKSQFDYTLYLKPSYLFGPTPVTTAPTAQYPLAVVAGIDFSYVFNPSIQNAAGTAWVDAVLENPGIWQKNLELVPNTATSGKYNLNFSLDVPQINRIFTEIETEMGLSSSSRNVTINAYYQWGLIS